MNEKTVREQYEFTRKQLRLHRYICGQTKWFMPSGTIPKNWCADNGVEFKIYITVLKQLRQSL